MTAIPVLLLLKVTIVFSLAAPVSALLRGRSAAARHLVWTLALLAAVVLLPLSAFAPRLPVRLPTAAARSLPALIVPPPTRATEVGRGPSATEWNAADARGSIAPRSGRPRRSPVPTLALLWLAGSLGVLLWSAFGHLGLWGLHRSSLPVERAAWARLCGLEPPVHGAGARVRLAHSSVVGTPLTWGWLRPIVLLPSRSAAWPLERRRAALRHELAHVERGDYVMQLVATLACAAWWFHPLAWWAAGRLRSESEHACDDRVLSAGTPAPEYASDLLAVAHGARGPGGSRLVAIGMARRSHLEGRLLAVLDTTRRRGVVRPRAGLAALALTLLMLVPFAGLEPRLLAAPATWASTSTEVQTTSTMSSATKTATKTETRKSTTFKPKPEDGDGPDAQTMDDTLPAKPGGRLVLQLDTGGSVEIQGWDRNEVSVHAELAGADWKSTQLAIAPESFGVGVQSISTAHGHGQSTSHHFEIRVPARYDVRLASAGGTLTLSGVEGTFEGSTGGGELVLDHARGRASLRTGGGDIEVTDSDLSGTISTGGGTAKLSRVKGGLKATSGSGPVIYADAGADGADGTGDLENLRVDGSGKVEAGDKPSGYLHVTRAGGAVDLDDAPQGGDIRTGGGDIRIAKGAGTIEARTGGGDITVGPVAGSISASTGAGDVRLQLVSVGGRGQSAQVWSGTGKVVVELPADLNARFEIETAYTRSFGRETKITSAWTLDRKPVTDWDDSEGTPRRFVRASGVAGRGEGYVKIQTVNGDVEIKKAGAAR